MKRLILLFLNLSFILLPMKSYASAENLYYASGNYVTQAPINPIKGLTFYVDNSAITTYGSVFTVAFDWNGDYKGKVSAVAQYPASSSDFPGYFNINTRAFSLDVKGQTFFYTRWGDLVTATNPMDSYSIYKAKISINSNRSVFNIENKFNSTYLAKTIRHEVGHVFLLNHPINQYIMSIMHQGEPNNSTISSTISSNDKNNVLIKWGN